MISARAAYKETIENIPRYRAYKALAETKIKEAVKKGFFGTVITICSDSFQLQEYLLDFLEDNGYSCLVEWTATDEFKIHINQGRDD